MSISCYFSLSSSSPVFRARPPAFHCMILRDVVVVVSSSGSSRLVIVGVGAFWARRRSVQGSQSQLVDPSKTASWNERVVSVQHLWKGAWHVLHFIGVVLTLIVLLQWAHLVFCPG